MASPWFRLVVFVLLISAFSAQILRAAGMLCLLGIGIGLGSIIVWHLIRQFLRRKPSLPSTDAADDDDDHRLLTTSDRSDGPIQGRSGDEDNAFDDDASIVSLPESGFDLSSNSDLDLYPELIASIRSDDDSVGSAPELQRPATVVVDVGDHRARLRRRKFGNVRETGVVDLELGNNDSMSCAVNSRSLCEIDSKSYSSEGASPTELGRDTSYASEEQQQGLVESGDIDARLNANSLNLSSVYTVDRSSVTDIMLRYDTVSPNRMFRGDTLESFDHSTPDERTSWMPRNRWTIVPPSSNFTLDLAPRQSVSYHDCCRDFPAASRSCMSIDLGEMSSISSYVSEMVDEGKLDCNAMNNMERIETELNDIQAEMHEMAKRVGRLQLCTISQKYNICPVDFSMDSVDDNFEVLPSPRRSSMCNLHQMSTVEQEASLVWDYDFDVEVGNDTFDLKSSVDCDDESVGQLESFVRYRSQKVARDAIRRSNLSMSDAASHLSRSDSMFSCLTPSYDDDSDQKSCSLYDVNRRLSGQFVIPSVSD